MGILRPSITKPEGVLDSLRLQKGHVEVASQRRAQIASQIAVHLVIPRFTEVKTINGDSGQTCTHFYTDYHNADEWAKMFSAKGGAFV